MKPFGTLDGPNVARGLYYASHALQSLVPDVLYQSRLPLLMERLEHCTDPAVFRRASYYHQGVGRHTPGREVQPFRLDFKAGRTAYQLDLHDGTRYFPPSYRIAYRFGDIREVPETPMFVKSRPIGAANGNAILFNLNKVRHFYFVRDRLRFADKRDLLVWRGRACQPHRKVFLAHYYKHPLCDVGHYHSRHQDVPWTKPALSVGEQLQYKFILSIEGNDVATSLKWILSSQSLCFMTRPRFETWFMEGCLIPGRHYVELKDDYSDLEEKIAYYTAHPEAAMAIIAAANRWVEQFRSAATERLVRLLVLWRYFHDSGQLAIAPPSGCAVERQDERNAAAAIG